jgi:hypothetical protein
MTDKKAYAFDWVLWVQWVLAGTLGWFGGMALFGDVGVGPAMGLLQWLVLRPRVPQAGLWVLFSTVGWAVGLTLFIVAPLSRVWLVLGPLLGAMMGFAQWLVLRRWFRLAAWWLVISPLAWAIGPLFGYLLVGTIVGGVTGVALELLVRQSAARPTQDNPQK